MFDRLKALGRNLKNEVSFYRRVMKHPETPRISRVLLWAALGYALSPVDLIPDFLPVIGHLDDLVIIPLLIVFALKCVPSRVIKDCRSEGGFSKPPENN